MNVCELVGKNIARHRAAKQLSQVQLAKRLGWRSLGIDQGYISKLEAGEKNPTLTTLAAIAEALGVSLMSLVAGADSTIP